MGRRSWRLQQLTSQFSRICAGDNRGGCALHAVPCGTCGAVSSAAGGVDWGLTSHHRRPDDPDRQSRPRTPCLLYRGRGRRAPSANSRSTASPSRPRSPARPSGGRRASRCASRAAPSAAGRLSVILPRIRPRTHARTPATARRPRRSGPAHARRRGDGGTRGGDERRHASTSCARCSSASKAAPCVRPPRRLVFCRRQSAGAADVRRRGAGLRGGQAGPALRRPLRPVARPHAQGRSGSTAPRSISPTSCRGVRPATARRRRRKARSACPSSAARSSSSTPTSWSASAARRCRRCSRSRTAS